MAAQCVLGHSCYSDQTFFKVLIVYGLIVEAISKIFLFWMDSLKFFQLLSYECSEDSNHFIWTDQCGHYMRLVSKSDKFSQIHCSHLVLQIVSDLFEILRCVKFIIVVEAVVKKRKYVINIRLSQKFVNYFSLLFFSLPIILVFLYEFFHLFSDFVLQLFFLSLQCLL